MTLGASSARIEEHELVALTRDLVAAGGENSGGTEEATVRVLEPACCEPRFDVRLTEVEPGRPNLVATLPPQNSDAPATPGLLFLGHSDVVPAGPGSTRRPFAGEV